MTCWVGGCSSPTQIKMQPHPDKNGVPLAYEKRTNLRPHKTESRTPGVMYVVFNNFNHQCCHVNNDCDDSLDDRGPTITICYYE